MMYIEAKGCMKMFCASSKEHAKKQLTLKKWYNSQRKSWKYMLNQRTVTFAKKNSKKKAQKL